MNPDKVGKTISFLRRHYNMTQHELASKIGVTDKAVSRWENGYGTPDISLLSKLSVVLDIDIESILEGNLSSIDLVWQGVLVLDSETISPADYIYNIRIVEFQVGMFLLAGIQNVTIIGEKNKIDIVKSIIGDGKQYGCIFNYIEENLYKYVDNIPVISEVNARDCVMLIKGSVFVYGKDITKCFRRIINDGNEYTVIRGYNSKDSKISFWKKETYGKTIDAKIFTFDRGVILFDLCDRDSLMDASNLVSIISRQMGEQIADLQEIAYQRRYIIN